MVKQITASTNEIYQLDLLGEVVLKLYLFSLSKY